MIANFACLSFGDFQIIKTPHIRVKELGPKSLIRNKVDNRTKSAIFASTPKIAYTTRNHFRCTHDDVHLSNYNRQLAWAQFKLLLKPRVTHSLTQPWLAVSSVGAVFAGLCVFGDSKPPGLDLEHVTRTHIVPCGAPLCRYVIFERKGERRKTCVQFGKTKPDPEYVIY